MDDIAQSEVSTSWMLDLLQKSRLYLGRGQSSFRSRKHKDEVREA